MASENLGVTLHENGMGVLCEWKDVRKFGGRTKKKRHRLIDSLNHPAPAIEIAIHVDGDVPPMLVLGRRNFHGPKYHGERDEHRVVRNVPPHADPLPKPVHDVALVLRIRRARRERTAVRAEVPGRLEQRRVLAVDRRVVVARRGVHEAHRALGDEHALVPVVLEGAVWDSDGQHGPPSEDLFDHGAQIGQTREVGERRDPASSHDGV